MESPTIHASLQLQPYVLLERLPLALSTGTTVQLTTIQNGHRLPRTAPEPDLSLPSTSKAAAMAWASVNRQSLETPRPSTSKTAMALNGKLLSTQRPSTGSTSKRVLTGVRKMLPTTGTIGPKTPQQSVLANKCKQANKSSDNCRKIRAPLPQHLRRKNIDYPTTSPNGFERGSRVEKIVGCKEDVRQNKGIIFYLAKFEDSDELEFISSRLMIDRSIFSILRFYKQRMSWIVKFNQEQERAAAQNAEK